MQNSIIASAKVESVAVALSDDYQKPTSGKYLSIKQVLKSVTHRTCCQLYRNRANLFLLTLVVLALSLPHLVRAEDLLSGQKQDAKDTFGHGSTVEWGLYMAEVVISIITFIKTRNPALFVGGLAFLVVVTRTLFALAG